MIYIYISKFIYVIVIVKNRGTIPSGGDKKGVFKNSGMALTEEEQDNELDKLNPLNRVEKVLPRNPKNSSIKSAVVRKPKGNGTLTLDSDGDETEVHVPETYICLGGTPAINLPFRVDPNMVLCEIDLDKAVGSVNLYMVLKKAITSKGQIQKKDKVSTSNKWLREKHPPTNVYLKNVKRQKCMNPTVITVLIQWQGIRLMY